MTDKEVRKLSRKELLELLIKQEKENIRLQSELSKANVQIENRVITIQNAGSIAEAALQLNGVFEAAEKAAEEYLENIKRCSEQQEAVYNKIVSEAEQKAKEIIASAEAEKQQKIREADAYWKRLSQKMEEFYQSHAGLRELIDQHSKDGTGRR